MNILSLFDGISCGQVALERVGIKVDKYYASEIDKYAIQITQKNYPNTIQLGDINNWHEWNIDWKSIDLVIGGSPCQGFSNAGKGLNFDDPRSRLFFVFNDILNHIRVQNPNVKFLLENVKMKKEWVDVISSYLGVKCVEINSSLVSAQNRQRLYWTNIADIPQPEDKGIKLKDILITTNTIRIPDYGSEDKSRPITSHYPNNFGGWYERINYPNPNKQQIDILAEPVLNKNKDINKPICVNSQSGDRYGKRKQPSLSDRVYDINGKNPALTASYQTNVAVPLEPCDYVKKKIDNIANKYGYLPEQFNPYNECEIKDKSPTLTSCCGSQTNSSCVMMFDKELYYKEKGSNKNVFEVKNNIITIYGKEYKIALDDGLWHIRKLCPIECERLQTLPDEYTSGISNSQRYKALGNGWTVDVIAHIFSFLPKNS